MTPRQLKTLAEEFEGCALPEYFAGGEIPAREGVLWCIGKDGSLRKIKEIRPDGTCIYYNLP